MRRAALARRTAETGMNRESSRSHAVLTLTLEAAAHMRGSGALVTRRARLNLVDLAGARLFWLAVTIVIVTLTLEAAARMPGSGALVTRRARLNLVDLAGSPVLAPALDCVK